MLAALLAVAVAAETFTGDVVTNDESNSNDLVWTFDDATGVLTISGTSTDLTLNPAPSWSTMGPETIPWWDHVKNITKVVITAPIDTIGRCVFNEHKACTTIVFPSNTIKLNGSMTFANMLVLDTFGPEGTEKGVIDLRNFTGSSAQAFEKSCADVNITVLMPTAGKAPISTAKVFTDSTVAVFKVVKGSASETTVNTIKENSQKDPHPSPYVGEVKIEYYDSSTPIVPSTPTTPNNPDKPAQDLQETKTATAAYGTPVIDGEIDEIWDTATAIDFPYDRQGASVDSLADKMEYRSEDDKPYAKMMWDANKLYILAFVPDADIQVADTISSYNRDGVEIYIDEPNEKFMKKEECTAYHQIQIVADGSEIKNQNAEVEYVANVNDDDGYYIIELAYTFHAVVPRTGLVIGYDMSVNCNNTGNNARDYCLSWNDRTNTTYYQPIYMGNLKLEGGDGVNSGVDTPSKEDPKPSDPVNPGDSTIIAQGKIEEEYSKCTWVLTSDGTITFTADASGWNEVPYCNKKTENRWLDHLDKIKKVVVGKGLGKIGAMAFKDCVNLEVVEFTSVGQIAASAFENCPKLTTIYVAGKEPQTGVFDLSGVTTYEGSRQFVNCGMTTLNMQGSLTNLAEDKFVDCVYLTNVTFGEKLESVNENAFAGCYNLKVVFGAKGGAAETFATAKGLTFATVGSDVEIPEAVVTTTDASETTPEPETTEKADTTAKTETTAGNETTKSSDEATQTSDINLAMVAAFAIAALGSVVVLMRKKRFN